ncbi:MAG TPA: TldD/PmbA family protein [Actinomycetota bacterium]
MAGLIGPDDVRKIADAALDVAGADGVEVLLMHEWGGLTRFASSSIHQSTWREDTGIRVRVVTDSRVGVASTNDFSKDGARRAAASALEMARVAGPDPLFPGLAPKAEIPPKDSYDEATANTTPQDRADGVATLVGQVGAGFRAAGAFETAALEIAIANSEGQFCYQPYTQASVTTVVSGGEGGAGTAEQSAGRVGEIDAERIGGEAFRGAHDSQNPHDVAPGAYEVVLAPLAVSTLMGFLAYVGFGGRSITEGRSPFSGRAGERVAAESITVVDDALDPESLGLAFDFEGTPKQRTPLIERGVFVQGVQDRRSAKQSGTESTGHALPPPNPEGPFPLNLVVQAGDASLQDMIAATKRGLLVTRFHYSNIVHPIETVITGMTRDGTWLIEDGAIAHPVKNLRYTQSILKALSDVQMVGRDRMVAGEFFFAASVVPALKIASFNFSGASDH